MKNAAQLATFVLFGTKVTLFCFFFQDFLELIF